MRALFLLDPSVIFLNHGSFGACPRAVFDTYQEWQRRLEHHPVEFLGRQSGTLLAWSRGCLSELLGCDVDDLVYIPNTTTGINIVARSISLRPGDEVLTSDQEYGACDNVWEHECRKAGARYVKQPIPLPLPSPEQIVELIWNRVTPSTRVLYLSHITSTTAMILPVAGLCQLARQAGILSVIDGAHVPGQLPLDLGMVNADVYVGNCHKWLLAPKGAAFLHVRKEHQMALDASVIGWGYSKQVDGHTSFDAYLGSTPFVKRHQWQGTRDISAYLSVPAAIDFQREHHWDQVRRRCHELALDTRNRLCVLAGLEPICDDAGFAQMTAIPLPRCDADALKKTLLERFRIEVPLTTHGDLTMLRVSFQGYNSQEDADALVMAVRTLLDEPGSPWR